jgi:hypothetical protein
MNMIDTATIGAAKSSAAGNLNVDPNLNIGLGIELGMEPQGRR